MTNEFQKTSLGLGLLFGGIALAILPTGCGSADEPVENRGDTARDDSENIAETSQELTQSVTLHRGVVNVIDTGIDVTRPTTNFGSQAFVTVGSSDVILVRWDLSSIPLGATVSSATVTVGSSFATGLTPRVHRVTRSWSEFGATWNNMNGAYDPTVVGTFPTMYSLGSLIRSTVNVTSAVNDWVSGKNPNYGFAIAMPAGGKDFAFIESSESPSTENRPTLRITYTTTFCTGKPDETSCNDNNGCTQTDTCKSYVCVGSNPKVCPSSVPCQANACNPATGMCAPSPLPNGTSCNDGNACTQTSSCQSGQCIGANPIVCPPLTPCHLPGVCQAATATCAAGATITPNLQDGLLHHWRFDEPSGFAADSANGHLGPAVGYPGSSALRVPSFDGTNALGIVPKTTTDPEAFLVLETTEPPLPVGTMSTWIKAPRPAIQGHLISTSWSELIVALTNTGKTRISFDNGTSAETSPLIADDTWHHLAFVRDWNGTFHQYVDGVKSFNSPLRLVDNHVPGFLLGMPFHAPPQTAVVKVAFEDFRIYDRPISPCEASALAKKPAITPMGPPSACAPNPVGFWKGDNSLVDWTGNNNGISGTLAGASPVTFADGQYLNAFALNGQSYVEIPNAPALQLTGNVTMSAWVYLNSAGGRIIDKVPVGGSNGYLLDTYGGKLRMYAGNLSLFTSPSTLPIGKWVHVAGTWNGTTGKLYVDGTLVHSYNPPNAQPLPINTLPLRIGADASGGNRLNGLVDEVALFKQVLTDEQVKMLASVVAPSTPVGWWKANGSFADAAGSSDGTSGTQFGAIPVSFAPGKIANAFVLNSQSYVQVPNVPALQVTGPITLSAWLFMKSSGGRIIDKITAGGTDGYLLDTYLGQLRMIAGNNPIFSSTTTVPINTWTHVAGTWDGATGKLYIDGVPVLIESPASPNQIPSSTVDLRIGADSNGASSFNGLIDEAAVHNVALSPTQIAAMALRTAPADLHTACYGTFVQPSP